MTPISRAAAFSAILIVAAVCLLPAAIPLIGFIFLPFSALIGALLLILLIWIIFRRRP
jgi:hypothetical protein